MVTDFEVLVLWWIMTDNVSDEFDDSLGIRCCNSRYFKQNDQTHKGKVWFHAGDVSLITSVFWEILLMDSSTSNEGWWFLVEINWGILDLQRSFQRLFASHFRTRENHQSVSWYSVKHSEYNQTLDSIIQWFWGCHWGQSERYRWVQG